MAKARETATPAKGTKKTSPAKATKAKSPTPANATRSSPRKAVPTAKAQEANAMDQVKTGRVTKPSPAKKKASPAKAATPAKTPAAKKTPPAKKTTSTRKTVTKKAATPSKSPAAASKAASTRSTPAKSPSPDKKKGTKASPATRATKKTSPKKQASSDAGTQSLKGPSDMLMSPGGFVSEAEHMLEAMQTQYLAAILGTYELLQSHRALDGNAKQGDGPDILEARSHFRKLKKAMRGTLGERFDPLWKRNANLADIERLWRIQYSEEPGRKGVVVRSTESDAEGPHGAVRSRGRSPAKSATTNRAASKSPAKRSAASPAKPSSGGVTTGRVTKRKSVSRSRSPAKRVQRQVSETRSQRAESARRKSSREMLARSPSKSPRVGRSSRSVSSSKQRSFSGMQTDIFHGDDTEPNLRHPRERGPVSGVHFGGDGIEASARPSSNRQASLTRRSRSPASRNPPSTASNTTVRTASSSFRRPSSSTAATSAPPSRRTSTQRANRYTKPIEPGRGNIISDANAEAIVVMKNPRANPFFETLPAPEVWHRRMPPFFPFGETPFMEAEMSRQIEEDLKRGSEDPAEASKRRKSSSQSWMQSLGSSASSLVASMNPFGSKAQQPEQKRYPSAWDLPEVDQKGFDYAMRELRKGGSRPGSAGSSVRSHQPWMSGGMGSLDGAH